MILKTGRSTTILAGAAILLVISVAFFLVFDLSTAIGSSSELPIVRIAQADVSEVAQAQVGATANAGEVATDKKGRSSVTPSTIRGTPVVHAASPSVVEPETHQTDDTTREYIEEEVRVQEDHPTTTDDSEAKDDDSRHPGQGRR